MLKDLREIMGLTQDQAADELSISAEEVAALEEKDDEEYARSFFQAFPLNPKVLTHPEADPFFRSYDQTSPARRLSGWMLENNISACRMAECLGRSPEYVTSLMNGKETLNRAQGEDLERYTGINRKWVMYGDGRNKGKPVPILLRKAETGSEENKSMLEKMAEDFTVLPDDGPITAEQQRQEKKQLGLQIRSARKEAGLSIRDASRLLGISESRMGQMECGVITEKRANEVLQVFSSRQARTAAGRSRRASGKTDTGLILSTPTGIRWGEKLRSVRREMGLSQQDVGDLIGVSHSAISLMEKGRVRKDTVENLIKMMKEKYGKKARRSYRL